MHKTVEFIGEGPTDFGKDDSNGGISGVVPIFVHKICGHPASLRVVRKTYATLQQKGGLAKKAGYAKQQAFYNGSAGVVFVVDTEGDSPKTKRENLEKARDAIDLDIPMAIGVAHPCIEAWLLADARAIARGTRKSIRPELVPADPEKLPAPNKNRKNNPKIVLADCVGLKQSQLSSADLWAIARSIKNLTIVETACPEGFAPFAAEIRERIKPIFTDSSQNEGASKPDL